MKQTIFSGLHPVAQLIFTVLVTFVSFFIVMILAVIAGIIIYNIPLAEVLDLLDMNDPSELSLLKFLQITQSIGIFIIPPLVIGYLAVRRPFDYLRMDQGMNAAGFGLTVLLTIVILPVLNILVLWNEGMHLPDFLDKLETWMTETEKEAGLLTESFLRVDSFKGYLVNVLMIAIIPAFGEEFMFRGVIQQTLQRWFRNPHIAILVASILFSGLHLQFYGFLPRFALGVMFGYLFYFSGNLWYAIVGHFVNNFIPVTLMFFMSDKFSPENLETIGNEAGSWFWAVPSLIISLFIIIGFARIHRRRESISHNLIK